jgi:hypothetical protein
MTSPFDIATIFCFAALVIAYFRWAAGDLRILLNLMLSGIALAVANQVGNAGWTLLGVALIVAGMGYAALLLRGRWN